MHLNYGPLFCNAISKKVQVCDANFIGKARILVFIGTNETDICRMNLYVRRDPPPFFIINRARMWNVDAITIHLALLDHSIAYS